MPSPVSSTRALPVTEAQSAIWFGQTLVPGSAAFVVAHAVELPGPVNRRALVAAATEALAEADGLLSTYGVDGDSVRRWSGTGATTEVRRHVEAGRQAALAWMRERAATPIDPSTDPVAESTVVEVGDELTFLLLIAHHIALDAYGLDLVVRRTAQIYSAAECGERAPDSWYGAVDRVLADEAAYIDSDRRADDERYWRQTLARRHRPASVRAGEDQAVRHIRTRTTAAGPDVVSGASRLAEKAGAGWVDAMTALLAAEVGGRISAQTSIRTAFGFPVMSRFGTAAAAVPTMAVNVLPLHLGVGPDRDLVDLTREVHEAVSGLSAHSKLRGERVDRMSGSAPGVWLNIKPFTDVHDFGGTEGRVHSLARGPVRELTITVSRRSGRDGGLDIAIDADAARYSADDLATIDRELVRFLSEASSPRAHGLPVSQIPRVSDAEFASIRRWNETAVEHPQDDTLDDLLVHCAARSGGLPAVIAEDAELDYATFRARVNALAHHLLGAGIRPGHRVAVCLPRSSRLPIALHAAVHIGAAYVPVDQELPMARIEAIIEDADPALIVSDGVAADWFGDLGVLNLDDPAVQSALDETSTVEVSDDERGRPVRPEDIAYVIFTSGSTGRPKGVAVSHRAVVNRLRWAQSEYALDADDRILQKTPAGFDVSVWEFFWPLMVGASLVMARPGGHRDPEYLVEVMNEHRVTTVHFVPTMLAAFLDEPTSTSIRSVRRVLCSGEPLPGALCRRFHENLTAELHNLYGPTEAAVDVTATAVPAHGVGDSVPIGHPIWNTTVHVLDGWLREVPIGEEGELYIGGSQVAAGYLGRPGLTAGRFVADPHRAGARLYRSGDVVIRRPDGGLDYVGRTDFQVKIHGQRIELGEIEAALLGHPGVGAAVARIVDTVAGPRVVGYVVPRAGSLDPLDAERVRTGLAETLPAHGVPAVVMVIDELPTTTSGKTDRNALPEPEWDTGAGRGGDAATDCERALAGAFTEVLGVGRVGVADDFFRLGGDSISALRLISAVRRRGWHIRTADVLRYPTVADLARRADPTAPGADGETEEAAVGPLIETPIMIDLLGSTSSSVARSLAQSTVVTTPADVDADALRRAVAGLRVAHGALRMIGSVDEGLRIRPRRQTADTGVREADDTDGFVIAEEVRMGTQEADDAVAAAVTAGYGWLNPSVGRMFRACWIPGRAGPGVLVMVAHHLAVDGVSWSVILEDLRTAVERGTGSVPSSGHSLRTWNAERRRVAALLAPGDRTAWQQILASAGRASIVRRDLGPADTVAASRTVWSRIGGADLRSILEIVVPAVHGRLDDVIVAATARAVADLSPDGDRAVVLDVEGHGREADVLADVTGRPYDVARTVGWFTTVYPVRVDVSPWSEDRFEGADSVVKAAKEALRHAPHRGIGYGYRVDEGGEAPGVVAAELLVNYLGRHSESVGGPWGALPVPGDGIGTLGVAMDPSMRMSHALQINAALVAGDHDEPTLDVQFRYAPGVVADGDVVDLVARFEETVAAIADAGRNGRIGGLTPSDITVALAPDELDDLVSRSTGIADVLAPTPLQEGLLSATGDNHDPYLVQLLVDVDGPLDALRLREAASRLLARHPHLASTFTVTVHGRPVAVVPERPVAIWREFDAADEAERDRLIADDRARGFDTAGGELIRFLLIRLGAERNRLVVTHHHAVLDGWSMPILIRELFALLGGERLPAAIPYADYLRHLERRDRAADRRAWSRALEGLEGPTIVVPAEAGRAPARPGGERSRRRVTGTVAPGIAEALASRARDAGITINSLVQTAWALTLGRHTGSADVVFGTAVAVRPPEIPGIDDAVGLLINTVPVRVDQRPDETVDDVAARLHAWNSALHEHRSAPLSEILGDLRRDILFDTLMVFENYPMAPIIDRATDLRVRMAGVEDEAAFPVTMIVVPSGGLDLELTFTAGVPEALGAALVESMIEALETIATDPHAMPKSVFATPETVPTVWSGPPATATPTTVVDLLDGAEGAATVIAGESVLSGDELRRRADELVEALTALGVRPESHVAVLLPRGIDAVIATCGVLRSPGVLVPIDPAHPDARVTALLTATDPAVVVTDAMNVGRVPATFAVHVMDRPGAGSAATVSARDWPVLPESGAVGVFTSGTTGPPKLTVMSHRALAARVTWGLRLWSVGDRAAEPDVRILRSVPGFVDAVTDLLSGVAAGSRIVVADDAAAADPAELRDVIRTSGVNRITTVPSVAAEIVGTPDVTHPDMTHPDMTYPDGALGSIRTWVVSGEALSADVYGRMRAQSDAVIINSYGSTEVAGDVAFAELTGPDAEITLGTLVPGAVARVLDHWLRPVPLRTPGELYVGGPQVARGYADAAALTGTRFVADPWGSGAVVFRTGDLVSVDEGGRLRYHGRADRQLSIRGIRVEPGEVEAALVAVDGVAEAAVDCREILAGEPVLVGYVTASRSGDHLSASGIRRELADVLPRHLVPATVVVVDRLPRGSNGKLDRGALPTPSRTPIPAHGRAAEPTGPVTGDALAADFAAVLGIADVDIADDFFSLGGHSLLANRLVTRLRARGVDADLRDVFDHPTPITLAEHLAASTEASDRDAGATGAGETDSGDRDAVDDRFPRPPGAPGVAPASFGQQSLWLADQLTGDDGSAYRVAALFAVDGDIDIAVLRRASLDVVAEHPVLRTVFEWRDDLLWQRALPVDDVDLDRLADAVHVPADATGDAIARFVAEPMDLATHVPFRVRVFHAEGTALLVLAGHHIATDEASFPMVIGTLVDAYRRRSAGAAEAPRESTRFDYQSHAIAQRRRVESGRYRDDVDFWRERLADLPAETALPHRRAPRPGERHTVATRRAVLPAATSRGLRALAGRFRVSPLMLAQLLIAAVLRGRGAGDVVPFGSPVSVRPDHGFADVVGYFVNTVVMTTDLAGNPLAGEALDRIRDDGLSAIEHGQVPFENVVDAVRPGGLGGRSPLFQVMIAYRDQSIVESMDMGDALLRRLDREEVHARFGGSPDASVAKFEMVFVLGEDEDGTWSIGIDYARELFAGETVDGMLCGIVAAASAFAADPGIGVDDLTAVASSSGAVDAVDMVTLTVPSADSASRRGSESVERRRLNLAGVPVERIRQAHRACLAAIVADVPTTGASREEAAGVDEDPLAPVGIDRVLDYGTALRIRDSFGAAGGVGTGSDRGLDIEMGDDGLVRAAELVVTGCDPVFADALATAVESAATAPGRIRVAMATPADEVAARVSADGRGENVVGPRGPGTAGGRALEHAAGVERSMVGAVSIRDAVVAAVISGIAGHSGPVVTGARDALVIDIEQSVRTDDTALTPGRLALRYPVVIPVGLAGADHATLVTAVAGCLPDRPVAAEVRRDGSGARLLIRWYETDARPAAQPLDGYATVVTVHVGTATAGRTTRIIRWRVDGTPEAAELVDARRVGRALSRAAMAPAGQAELIRAAAERAVRDPARPTLVGLGAADLLEVEATFGAWADVMPASGLQQGLLFHMQLAAETGAADPYVSQARLNFSGRLSQERLRAAVRTLLVRHPNLRAGFTMIDGGIVQVVPERVEVPVRVLDGRSGVDVDALLQRERETSFRSDRPPLVRFLAVRVGDDGWVLAMTFEHALLDGWSYQIVLDELLALYDDPDGTGLERPALYREYAMWLQRQDTARAASAWADYLAGLAEPTILRPDAVGSTVDLASARDYRTDLPIELSAAVEHLARRAGSTASTVLRVAWGVTLSRLTGSTDVVFGATVSGRPPEVPGADRIVGLLFNTVPVRVRSTPWMSVEQLVRATHRAQIQVIDVPFVSLTDITAGSGLPQLFDTLFVTQNHPVARTDRTVGPNGGIRLTGGVLDDATHYPISISAMPGNRIHLRCAYRGDLYSAAQIDELMQRYVRVLSTMVESPDVAVGAVTTIAPAEFDAEVRRWNETTAAVPDRTVAGLFAMQATATPEAPALVAGDVSLTFGQLHGAINRLARVMIDRGVRPEHRVALILPRDERMVIAMFAVFAAGAAYVPIDPDLPLERARYIVGESAPSIVISTSSSDPSLVVGHRSLLLDSEVVVDEIARMDSSPVRDVERGGPVRMDNLAYLIFTSGSTGRPKGVAVGYRGLTNMYVNHVETIFNPVVAGQQGRRLAIAHTTSFSFDASWEQLFWLVNGHCVHIIDETLRKEPAELLEHYDRVGIDGFDSTPSYIDVLVEQGLVDRDRPAGRSRRAEDCGVVFVSLGGEAVPDALWTRLRTTPGVESYNLYGPTEYTINALGADLADSETPTLGHPITNTRAYVLDDGLNPVPAGVIGELYLAGAGIARGYHGRPGLTAERFPACPWGGAGERMYRTGDRVRRRGNGALDYLGRTDDQIKIRGYRVEPAEIVDSLVTHRDVARAAVVAPLDSAGQRRLLAFVVPAAGRTVNPGAVRAHVRTALPDYMVPAAVIPIGEIPLTVNGKVDVRALPVVEVAVDRRVPPATATEAIVADVTAELLGVHEVSVVEPIRDMGGTSLTIMRLVSRLADVLGKEAAMSEHLAVTVRDVLSGMTVREIAARVTGADSGGEVSRADQEASPLTEFVAASSDRSVYCFPEGFGLVVPYAVLADRVPPGWGLYGLPAPEPGGPPEVVAAAYADLLESRHPAGDLDLLGWSYGGHLAYWTARELTIRGRRVASLTIIDAYPSVAVADAPVTVTDARDRAETDLALRTGAPTGVSRTDLVRRTLFGGGGQTDDARSVTTLPDDDLAAMFESYAGCERTLSYGTRGVLDVPTAIIGSEPNRDSHAHPPTAVSAWAHHLTAIDHWWSTSFRHARLLDPAAVSEWIPTAQRIWREKAVAGDVDTTDE